ncbi:MAG TPA: tRNA (adenosine(37)-N6)-threonylcarbamoyltransferase complex dimerization subunit type 1 TsaB [Candidatus Angelobacter sp.]
MLILGIDTSGKSGGVTLADGDEHSFRVYESAAIAGGTFSAQLVPTVAEVLARHGFKARDLEGFAVASGPGSFTGLRVGLSAVKALAETLHRPIATVSLLEVLASFAEAGGPVAAVMEAGRGELFVGIYFVQSNRQGVACVDESLRTPGELLQELRTDAHPTVITCDEPVAQWAGSMGFVVLRAPRPDSERIAQLGLKKLLRGETVAPETLDANYLRRSDAEIFFPGVKA